MLFIERTNEKIEHTIEYIDCTNDLQYESYTYKPVIYLFHGSGAQINWNGPMLISKGFDLCVSV